MPLPLIRHSGELEAVDLAAEFIVWAEAAARQRYWLFHRDQFLELLPSPGRRTSSRATMQRLRR
jgi:hypothetical protein